MRRFSTVPRRPSTDQRPARVASGFVNAHSPASVRASAKPPSGPATSSERTSSRLTWSRSRSRRSKGFLSKRALDPGGDQVHLRLAGLSRVDAAAVRRLGPELDGERGGLALDGRGDRAARRVEAVLGEVGHLLGHHLVRLELLEAREDLLDGRGVGRRREGSRELPEAALLHDPDAVAGLPRERDLLRLGLVHGDERHLLALAFLLRLLLALDEPVVREKPAEDQDRDPGLPELLHRPTASATTTRPPARRTGRAGSGAPSARPRAGCLGLRTRV